MDLSEVIEEWAEENSLDVTPAVKDQLVRAIMAEVMVDDWYDEDDYDEE